MLSGNLQAQSISGIINIYTPIVDISGSVVTVTDPAGFAVGDRVLLIQMQGATINLSETDAFGDIIDYGGAGSYQFSNILAIVGSVFTLDDYCGTFDAGAASQLVRVPVYDAVTVTGELTAPAWNGATGGVVVFEATTSVTLLDDINVDGKGFRGGSLCNGFFFCGDDGYGTDFSGPDFGECASGGKGEGIAVPDTDDAGGRGKSANGGGGSNTGQHGGAGGGNYGLGGRSAFEWTGCFPYDEIWAFGGSGLDYSVNRMFLGGGGGGGHQDNFLSVTSGADGGGIVIIRSPLITGNSNTISAKGLAVTAMSDSEGAGGGGAGGSVLLLIDDFVSTLNVDVSGGDGGDISSTFWAGTCHGPGGGGGGGFLGLSPAAVPAEVIAVLDGGAAGIINSPGAFCDDTPHGAEAGASGGIVTDINLGDLVYPIADLGPDTTVCSPASIILSPGDDYTGYLWSTGDITATLEVSVSGSYWVEVQNDFGCTDRDTIVINVVAGPIIALPDEVSFCDGETVVLDASGGGTSWLWNTGATTSSITVGDAGLYWVAAENDLGCVAQDTTNVIVFPLPAIDLGNDTAACVTFQPIVLDVTIEGGIYTWSDGSTNPELTVTTPGYLQVTVVSPDGCTATDDILIFDACAAIFIPNAFSPNADGTNDGFGPVIVDPVQEYDFEIYNRWGEMVFSSEALEQRWDGTFKGKDAELGVYVWTIRYVSAAFNSGEVFRTGTVTLVR